MKRLLITLVFATALLAPAVAANVTFHAWIDGEHEVPATASPAWGVAVLELDPATGEFDLTVNLKRMDEPLAASHIHLAPAGANGGVIVALGGESAYRRVGRKNLRGKFSGTVPAVHVEAMLANGTYLNFHTATYPGGATRGQLIARPVLLGAELSGANEVPANPSPANGFAVMLYNPGTKQISLYVEADDFANVITGSHIHTAPVGANGPVTLGLGAEAVYKRRGDTVRGVFLKLDYPGPSVPLLTGGTYLNVHSTQYPGGEIRGQIVK